MEASDKVRQVAPGSCCVGAPDLREAGWRRLSGGCAADDKRFFSHNRIDYLSIPRVIGKVVDAQLEQVKPVSRMTDLL
jgi:hypothetical protein